MQMVTRGSPPCLFHLSVPLNHCSSLRLSLSLRPVQPASASTASRSPGEIIIYEIAFISQREQWGCFFFFYAAAPLTYQHQSAWLCPGTTGATHNWLFINGNTWQRGRRGLFLPGRSGALYEEESIPQFAGSEPLSLRSRSVRAVSIYSVGQKLSH